MRKKVDKYCSAVGISENIIEASWQALVDGLEYGVNGSRKG
jgi:2-isopropylmalate synthase